MTATRVNPHREDALTADTIQSGTYFACWQVDSGRPARYYTALGTPYHNDDGYLVIKVRSLRGEEFVIATSDLGLTCDPFGGKWSHIAIAIDRESAG